MSVIGAELEIHPAKTVLNKWLYQLSSCQKDIYLHFFTQLLLTTSFALTFNTIKKTFQDQM